MAEPPTPAPPAPGPTPDPAPPAPAPARVFTQEEVNSLLAGEKRRLLADQPDLAELRDKAKKFDELDAASKSELEREKARADAAEKRATDALNASKQIALSAAITTAATKAGAIDPDAVLALIAKDSVTIGDDGRVTGVDEAVKALLESKPYLVGKQPPTPPAGGDGGHRGGPPTPGQLTQADLDEMVRKGDHDGIAKAHREGRFNQLQGATP